MCGPSIQSKYRRPITCMLSLIETGSPAVFCALIISSVAYRLSARPAVSEVSRMHSSSSSPARIICFSCIHVINSSYFIIILIIFIIIINMSGKIIIIITTTIIIIITNGNLSINTEKKRQKLRLAV
ncbi:hypothetical protein ElyMa_005436900 [Elysia marginata]|uniref:Uncharacterized protein n=1 Tax=Elysia marginata TaxID=1093978 RepID=A0AAV4ELP1_9GAST|nr:hypothetical protein ElyMa_005436900 [Elysia marginata]